MKFLSVIMVMVMLAATSSDAWAKRLGGGSSIGQQSSNVNRSAPPAQNVNRPATAPNQPAQSRPWGAMLGGLAAGLGLAWLASSLGLGEAFAQMLLLLLVGAAIAAIVFMVLRRVRAGTQGAPLAFQGAGRTAARNYSPSNVGNDASARPWERTSNNPFGQKTEFSNQGGSMIGSALNGPQTWGIPAGFDTEGFLRACKGNFVKLQDAWDRADIPALRALMTDEMLTEIQAQLREREAHAAGSVNKTEVVMLEAQLLGIEELNGVYMASVEFSGMIREDSSAGPNPFREVWNITRPIAGSGGWLVAGVQALQ